ncbi:transcriptional enhancer factor TEF-1 [Manduca sexta]|uniref:transcriptional enhancer factor TEF-1 n=1 Tax=Manduca sexta TaxID=7130 RepID=UPI00188F63D9|nr:transcriptional enhancer factor TEF-1 [Manduca sexta]
MHPAGYYANLASGALAAGTIASPWSTAAGAPDTNGSGGADAKHLDVGDASDDEKDMSAADAEGVWSPDIEQSFQEALAIYPPCGRRKIILSDEGKMYGRNELIARYIKLRTGKTRTRKQVSSHIQVLARRKLREIQAKLKVDGGVMKEKAMQSMSTLSSAQIVAGLPHPAYHHTQFWQPGLQAGTSQDYSALFPPHANAHHTMQPCSITAAWCDTVADSGVRQPFPGHGRAIATHKLRLVEFSAFVEHPRDPDTYPPSTAPVQHLFVHIGGTVTYADPLLESVDVQQINDKFPEKKGGLKELYEKGPRNAFFLVKFWADLNTNNLDDPGAFYGVTSVYESNENMTITCSTKVCSFGKQVVEKVETEYARFEGGRFVYRIHRSPMCEYMVNFIHKLKHLPEKYMMNSVLENFTILQVVSNRDTQETLLCAAFVFEVSNSEHGAQHHIYRLVKD